MIIDLFTDGKASVRNRLNKMVKAINRIFHMKGDGLIKVSYLPGGIGIGLSVDRLIQRLPRTAYGICKIVSVVGSGEYTATRVYWNNTTNAYVVDTVGEFFEFSCRDYDNRETGAVDQYVRYWAQEDTIGVTDYLIDVSLPGTSGKSQYMVLQLDASLDAQWDWLRFSD